MANQPPSSFAQTHFPCAEPTKHSPSRTAYGMSSFGAERAESELGRRSARNKPRLLWSTCKPLGGPAEALDVGAFDADVLFYAALVDHEL